MIQKKKLVIVVPVYFEEAVLPETISQLSELLSSLIAQDKVASSSQIIFVNDGSTDESWEIIKSTKLINHLVTGISFSRNFGHQAAVLAGMEVASKDADMIISIDADLQDDVQAIEKMVDAYHQGFDVVYGVRDNRESDTFFKKFTAETFYKMMSLLGAKTVANHADFRLMSNRATRVLLDFPERNLFLRGMVPLVGFKHTSVYYKRHERFAGESKYPLKKMIQFAFDGITSFSTKPLSLIFNLGLLVIVTSLIILIYTFIQYFTAGTNDGWASLMTAILFIGGVQIVSVAVVGQYVGKIFTEVKQRPRYIIEENLEEE
ncbi:glycosyltransferase family 2 protein [Lactococcus piscium]|uniref:glycosyltransferase family 2 protein n=1 Tax=Pseudolactococcus carnosus TaxID=2749961 RepID=UPI001FBBD971|nr:glycosyltransferase family 2 protein [Lactococcus carnosus]MCJ1996252.1 glycosyltransferase family 2 protein [Lactococcus carnosus]